MTETKRVEPENTDNHRQALASALPLLLVGLGGAAITTVLLLIGGPSHVVDILGPTLPHTFALIAAVVMLAVLVVAALIAIAHRLPLWAYPWMAVDAIGLMVALNLAAEDRAFVFSPTADIVVLVLFFLASLTTLSTAALRGWQRTGLLSVGFSATMGLSLCFWAIAGPFRSDLGLLTAPLGLLMAALTYAYVRGSDSIRIAVLLSIGLTNTGLTWAVDRVFRSWDLFPDESSLLWPLLALSTGPLLGGPLLGLLGQRLHLAFQRKRRRVVG